MPIAKKPQYAFLPKRMKDVINHVEPRQMYDLVEAGYDTEFCYIPRNHCRLDAEVRANQG